MNLDWALNGESMGLAALAAGDSAAFLSGMNPSIFTIRSQFGQSGGDDTAKDIHIGMIIANALAITVGFGASAVSGSWWPVTITVGVTIILDIAYEWALRCPRENS
jgi:hypothetical protein